MQNVLTLFEGGNACEEDCLPLFFLDFLDQEKSEPLHDVMEIFSVLAILQLIVLACV